MLTNQANPPAATAPVGVAGTSAARSRYRVDAATQGQGAQHRVKTTNADKCRGCCGEALSGIEELSMPAIAWLCNQNC